MILSLLLSLQSAPPIEREWVLKEIHEPPPLQGFEESQWWGAHCVQDFDGDGVTEWLLSGQAYTGLGSWTGWRLSVNSGAPRGRELPLSGTSTRLVPYGWPRSALVRAGMDFGILVPYTYPLPSGIAKVSIRTGELLGTAITSAGVGGGHSRAADFNGDGHEEYFVVSSWGGIFYDCMLDGLTGTMTWSRPLPPNYGVDVYPMRHSEPTPTADFNLDGWPDQISAWGVVDFNLQYHHHFRALDGPTGALLWTHDCVQTPGTISACSGVDVTGDGVPDAALRGTDAYEGIDGTTGAALWATPHAAIAGWLPSGYFYTGPRDLLWLDASATTPGGREMIGIHEARAPGALVSDQFLAHLDGATGTILGVMPIPLDQQPWHAESLLTGAASVSTGILGDIDRDGFKDWGLVAKAPDDPLHTAYATRWAVLGQKTWFVAQEAHPGETLAGSIAIPSAPGRPVNLLLSRGFDGTGGVRLGAWKTHLAPDALLTKTLADRPYTSVLDQDGRGTLSFTIPNDPALIGQTLYSKVAVLAGGPGREVWTLSTLGQTQIVP